MTDNATELLCKLLEERGVEFDTDIDECCYDEPPKTTWDFVLCGLEMTVTATEFVDVEGKKYLEMDFHHAFTPEQAIAATLGNRKSTADAIAELRKVVREAFSGESVSILVEGHAIMRAIDAVEAATLGGDRHPYEQRITGDGSDWGEIMCDAYDDLMASACETCTPEQMEQLSDYIRSELGSEREKRFEKLVRIYGEIANYFCERFACCDAEFANCKYCIGLPQDGQCELGWCNDESKALGIEQPDYGGGECEPVNLEELYDRIAELESERATHGTLTAEQVRKAVEGHGNIMDNRLYENWQAVADELNAKLGSRTCEVVSSYYYDDYDQYEFEFSCGHSITTYEKDPFNFCPICGALIRKAVEQ